MMVNRRKHLRYPVTRDEVFVLGRYSNNVAAVRNISRGGLQFEYVQGAYPGDQWTLVDLICENRNQLMLPCLQCAIVYDIRTLAEGGPYTGAEARHCGARFLGLTDDQEACLGRLFRYLTDEPAK